MELARQDLGLIEYSAAREIQNQLIAKRLKGEIQDTVIFCEHPPTITLGKRTRAADISLPKVELERCGFSVYEVERGGSVTVHNPGQLVIYPVIDLRDRGLGVRRFVELGLEAIVESLVQFGVNAVSNLGVVGVWCVARDSQAPAGKVAPRKIAQVGLKIVSGVTNHGFSVNINNELEGFGLVRPCGLEGVLVTSISEETRGGMALTAMGYSEVFFQCFRAKLEPVRQVGRVCHISG